MASTARPVFTRRRRRPGSRDHRQRDHARRRLAPAPARGRPRRLPEPVAIAHPDEARRAKGKAALALPDLESHADGLVCLTGGPRGPLARLVSSGRYATTPLDRLATLVASSAVTDASWRFSAISTAMASGRSSGWSVSARAARVGLVATNQPLYAGRAAARWPTSSPAAGEDRSRPRRPTTERDAERGLRGPVAMPTHSPTCRMRWRRRASSRSACSSR